MAEESGALNRVEEHENVNEDTTATTSCGCFRGLCSRWSTQHRYELCQEEQKSLKDNKKNLFKKLKALSSLLRRLRNSIGSDHKKKKMQFQYDAKSYALNFDDGREKEEGDGVYLDFSSRYACPLGIKKVYLGLGEEK